MLIDRPSPLPPLRRARDSSARQKRLNTSARLPRPQPDTVVAHHHGDGVVVAGQRDVDRAALAVVHGVRHEVAHDPLDPARVDLGVDPDGQVQPQRRAGISSANPRTASTARVTTPCMSTRSAVRSATPASSRLISSRSREQRLEPVELRHQQLRAAPQRGQQLVPGGVQDVGGHPDGGQRRAQLVADVRGEPPLQRAELLELADLVWMLPAISLYDSASRATSSSPCTGMRSSRCPSANRSAISAACRTGRTTCRVTRLAMPGQQQEQHEPADDQRALHERRACAARRRAGTAGRTPGRRPAVRTGWPMISVGISTPCAAIVT